MNWYLSALSVAFFVLAEPAAALQPPQRPGSEPSQQMSSVDRWVQQLDNEVDHLQEDLQYERGSYPNGLSDRAEQASRAITHFRRTLRRTNDREHLLRDFEEMDQQVHQLVLQLEGSGDSWLRRQASRIRYADEQLHYVLKISIPIERGGDAAREVLARHAHVLEAETKNLQTMVERFGRRGEGLHEAVATLVDEVVHFHQVVERGADYEHLEEDFRDVDQAWRGVVEHLNRLPSQIYLLRRAQDVNRVHNQIRDILTEGHVESPDVVRRPPPPQRGQHRGDRRGERRGERPRIEVEIPGIGRFEFPR